MTVFDLYKELEVLVEDGHRDCYLRPCFNASDGVEGVSFVVEEDIVELY